MLTNIAISVSLIVITIARGVINASIYNKLHNTNELMIYTADNTSRDEIDKSNGSMLFAIYCILIFV